MKQKCGLYCIELIFAGEDEPGGEIERTTPH